jgi:hypothetical protein
MHSLPRRAAVRSRFARPPSPLNVVLSYAALVWADRAIGV